MVVGLAPQPVPFPRRVRPMRLSRMGLSVVTGKVVRFDEFRGYGFVAPDSGGEDVFIHVNDLHFDKRLIAPGALVEFTVEDSNRGLKASGVRILEQAPGQSDAPAPRAHQARSDEDGLCDVLSANELAHEITEALLEAAPAMTGEQILNARQRLVQLARRHGWVE